ncbi:hypothetical protein VZ95_03075 [Elstera litoralis]|uniref:Uncharacterized protein n=1 Tax=Elstera litoralis TaxID=552518 RepID=A0A0F3IVE6_9PROT|nr:hypothetical protein VZ95_03075 [Elstera litoralis]
MVKDAESLGGSLGTAMDHALAAATETGTLAAEKLGSLAGNARSLGEEGLATFSKTIERNPLAAIAIAAGAGLIAGLLCRRTDR